MPPAASRRAAPVPWALLGALAVLPLLWASRSPTLGMPVADDYLFLSRLAFERPLEFFGPMGAAYYWRPVSRQLYYLLVGPWLLRAPWVATLVALLLLLALYATLYRLARRGFSPPLAAAIACFPLLSEPARVLLLWPSAAQHLLGALFAALAVERAVAGGLVTSCAAALLAVLSNEAAAVVLPALPLIAWLRTRSPGGPAGAAAAAGRRALARWGGGAIVVGLLWGAGYAVARGHGAGLPAGSGGATAGALAEVVLQALVAQLGLEKLAPALQPPLFAGFVLLLAAGLAALVSPSARARVARGAPVWLGGLAWFAAAAVPLVFVRPDWNAWRTTVGALGLGFALAGGLALSAPRLVAGLVALRLATLLLAPVAPAVVSREPPASASSFSFERLVRLQRVVESARRALGPGVTTLPRAGVVRYREIPLLAEVGFHGQDALRVWSRDTTLRWARLHELGGDEGRTDAMLEFEPQWPWPGVRITAAAVRLRRLADRAATEGRPRAADSLYAAALLAQPGAAPVFSSLVTLAQAQIAWNAGDYARADSLGRASLALCGDNPAGHALAARLALLRGDAEAAREAVRRCLAIDPSDADGLRLARALGALPPGR
jgi:hypothetical protein